MFHHFLLAAGLIAALSGSLRAQDVSSSATPAPMPPGSGGPTQDQVAPAPAPDQSQGFTSNDATGATQGDASFQTFYDALSNQGTWIQSGDYGYVWQPQVSDPNWAPYTEGYWAYTDAGWTWVSDEQFGWATYHYGRWANLDGYGWVWVPGYTWAPAWVSWRYGDGYAGWAPLPPDSFAGVDYENDGYSGDFGYHIGGDCDDFYGIGAGLYIFLPVNCLCYRHYHQYYCDRNDNWRYIGHTTNVTNINVSRGQGTGRGASSGSGPFHRVTVGGPQLAEVNAASPTPIQKLTLTPTNQRGGGILNGHSLALYAPHVNAYVTGSSRPQPAQVSGLIGQAKINHGTDILKPLAVNSRLAPPPPTAAQVQQARIEQSQMLPTARVLMDESSVKPVLQQPLTSMKPFMTATRSGGTPAATTPGATYRSPQVPATAQSYIPDRVYPQAGENEPAPVHTYTPGTVYPSSPSRAVPSETPAVPRTYAPASVYPSNSSDRPRYAPSETGGGGTETHTYVRPEAPAIPTPTAPEYHSDSAPVSSGGGESSHAAASGESSTSSSSVPASSGGPSSGAVSGGGGFNNGRSH